MTTPPVLSPVVTPVSRGGSALTSGLPVAITAGLALVVAISAMASLMPSAPVRAPDPGTPFGTDVRPRLEALRDRLVTGLLSLRRPDGVFSPRNDDQFVDVIDRIEATAVGLAGLGAARRMGSKVEGLDAAYVAARDHIVQKQAKGSGFGGGGRPGRGRVVSALSCAVLGYSFPRDPTNGPRIDRAAEALVGQTDLGPLPGGWVQGVAARAMIELARGGRLSLLGLDPATAIPTRPVGDVRDAKDARVSEALAESIRYELGGPPSSLPEEILAKVLASGVAWSGPQTDMDSLALQSWLASRARGGGAWFPLALKAIEDGIGPDGVVTGDFYGHPVSRTSCALLILWEGWELRPTGGG